MRTQTAPGIANLQRLLYLPAVLLVLVSWLAIPAQASVYTYRAADGTVTFSDVPLNNGNAVRSRYRSFNASGTSRPATRNPCRGLEESNLDQRATELYQWFAQASALMGVDRALLKAVARVESCFDAAAVSQAGARGVMQLMPRTAQAMQVEDSFDMEQNIVGGARYLANMLRRYSNDLDLALAAYNAGPGTVDRYNGIPPFSETRRYIASVKAFMQRYQSLQPATTTHTASN